MKTLPRPGSECSSIEPPPRPPRPDGPAPIQARGPASACAGWLRVGRTARRSGPVPRWGCPAPYRERRSTIPPVSTVIVRSILPSMVYPTALSTRLRSTRPTSAGSLQTGTGPGASTVIANPFSAAAPFACSTFRSTNSLRSKRSRLTSSRPLSARVWVRTSSIIRLRRSTVSPRTPMTAVWRSLSVALRSRLRRATCNSRAASGVRSSWEIRRETWS